MTVFTLLPEVGEHDPASLRPAAEEEFIDRVKVLLGGRLRPSTPTKQQEADPPIRGVGASIWLSRAAGAWRRCGRILNGGHE